MTRYLLDTNIFRDIAEGRDGKNGIDHIKADKVKEALVERGDAIIASVETLYELVTHINDEEIDNYPHIHSAIGALLHYTDEKIADHADYVLQASLLGRPRHQSVADGALDLARAIRSAKHYGDLYDLRYYIVAPGIISYPLPTHLRMLRDKELHIWEAEWASDMIYAAEETFWPKYRDDIAAGTIGGIADDAQRAKALKVLESQETLLLLMVGIAIRVGITIPVNQEMVDRLQDGLCAFYCAYKGIWRKVIETGYNFLKPENMNDFVDMQLLMHLIEDDIVLVTNDGRLRKVIKEDCKQYGRVITFGQLAESLDVA